MNENAFLAVFPFLFVGMWIGVTALLAALSGIGELAERYPDSAKLFEEMAEEERGHRHRLLELYERRFGAHLPPIRREDVRGFLKRRPIWFAST